jgi:hypothetical protein
LHHNHTPGKESGGEDGVAEAAEASGLERPQVRQGQGLARPQ